MRCRPWLLRIAKVLGVLAFGVAVIGSIYGIRHMLYHSPTFALQNISIQAGTQVAHSEIQSLSQVQTGQNIFSLDLPKIEQNIAQNPWIKQVAVSRQIPKTLEILVKEYKTGMVVDLGHLYLAESESGMLFKQASAQETKGFPILTGFGRSEYIENPAKVHFWAKEASRLHRLYQKKPDRTALYEIKFVGPRSDRSMDAVLYIETDVGVWVPWGDDLHVEQALAQFDLAWADIKRRHQRIENILINNRMHPTWVVVDPKDRE